MIRKEERIGGQRLILGDCLEVMPLLGKFDAVVACCDAVVYTDKHGKTANWEPETPERRGVDMGKPQGGDNSLVYQWANVTGATGGSLRDEPARDCAGIEANGHQAEIAGTSGQSKRSVHRRDSKHDLQEDGRQDALQQVRGGRSTRCASCGRGPHEQRGRKFGSPMLALPQQSPQAGMVGLPKGWSILTDPPYGIGMDGGKVGRSEYEKKGWDNSAPNVGWIVQSGRPAIIWGGNYFEVPPSDKWLVWDKKNDPTTFADCELAWTNVDGAVRVFRWLWSGPYQQKREQRWHPTQKPIALMEWCLGFLPDATTILDPFMGSGTTLVACQKLGRQGTGIELDPDYFDIACKRVDEATRQPDLFIEPPAPKPTQEGLDL